IVRAETGWKDQRGLLAMPLGKAGFQAGIQLMGSADIARSAGAGAVGLECYVHLLAHRRVLGHSQVVVAAPDNDRLPVAAVELCQRVLATDAAERCERAVLVGGLQ